MKKKRKIFLHNWIEELKEKTKIEFEWLKLIAYADDLG